MKIWWVLAWDTYYPGSALLNVNSTWETEEDAEIAALKIKDEDHVRVVNVSDMLGIEE